MDFTPQNVLMSLLAVAGGITVFILVLMFIVVPVFKGVGSGIGAVFAGIGWLFTHLFEFIVGMGGDILRFVGSLLVMLLYLALVPLNILIGRWSAASHFAQGLKQECAVGAACVYRVVIQRPLKLVLLHGLLEGIEQRVPEMMNAAPTADKPSRRAGQYDGYTIVGSLRAGGSGAKLYIAEPSDEKRRKTRSMADRVVIKSFAITEGSSLPQIVRESRALECAKQMGLVLDHGMDEHRFFYVMPYHPGDHLGILTRQMHGECGNRGLDQKHLTRVLSHATDLLHTLSGYHKGGLWHKDVKPENVIVHDGRAHLVDLGLVTPLRSAMTLTTHGTEYFRDPEMVRQALRGVKVHQVDGAKFDVYAVGAVLYFMIENTFPAHGGLSRFVTPAPESLRWIIRRAMTEYHQRYATADEMLADVEFVARSRDAFAVKPADLPSMRGGAPAVHSLEQPEMIASAGTPAVQGFGFAGGIAAGGPFAHVGNFKVDADGNPLPRDPSPPSGKPKLTVTNWWTGAYRVDEVPAADGVDHDEARAFRDHAYAFRQQAGEIGKQAKLGAMSARKAAREQIKAARQRAHDIRNRAMKHRHNVTSPHMRGSRVAVAIGAVCLIALFMVLAGLFFTMSNRSASRSFTMASAPQPRQPLMVVVDSDEPLSDVAHRRIIGELAKYDSDQYMLLPSNDPGLGAQYASLIREWWNDQNGPADAEIEQLLARNGAYGIVSVRVEKAGSRKPKLNVALVHSTAPGAKDRGRAALVAQVPAEAPPVLPYLLINDHPVKAEPKVEAEIDRIVTTYRERGWQIVTNDEAEVLVRKWLPSGPIEDEGSLSPVLNTVLREHGLGGVLRIGAKPGEGSPVERIEVTLVDGDEDALLSPDFPDDPIAIDVPPAPAAPVAPPAPGSAISPQSAAVGVVGTHRMSVVNGSSLVVNVQGCPVVHFELPTCAMGWSEN